MSANEETTARRAAEKAGVLMFLGWILILGVGGFLLLGAMAYAMITENLALGVVCGLLLFAPSALGVGWMLTAGASLVAERSPRRAKAKADARVLSHS